MKKIIILFLTAMICISIHGQANDKYRLKYNNPDLIVDLGVGLWGMPIPIDYDGDGLMDLLMTCPSTPHKGIFYFHNIGNSNLFSRREFLICETAVTTCFLQVNSFKVSLSSSISVIL